MHQCTIIWHVNNLKISHVDSTVVDYVLKLLKLKYSKLQTTRALVHECLCMTLHFISKGKVIVNMHLYITKILDDATEITGEAKTLAIYTLFKVPADAEPLHRLETQRFHTLTAKLLFLEKRGRPHINTAVAFLTMCV